jgi:hypothetical protein
MRVSRCCNFSGVNVIRTEDEKNLPYCRKSAHVGCVVKTKVTPVTAGATVKSLKLSQAVPEQRTGKALYQ